MDRPLRRDRRRRPVRRRRDRDAARPRRYAGARHRGRPARAPTRCPRMRSCGRRAATAPLGSARRGRRRRYPGLRATEFSYGDEIETVDIRPGDGISALRAPRRTVLDPLLLEAARAAGAEVRIPARVTRVLERRQQGAAASRESTRGTGARFRATATLTIGADGRNSTIAQGRRRRRSTARHRVRRPLYGYFPGLPPDRYHWAYRPGLAAGVVPTNDGLACVWAGTSSAEFARWRPKASRRTFRAARPRRPPRWPDRSARTSPVGALRAFPGRPG